MQGVNYRITVWREKREKQQCDNFGKHDFTLGRQVGILLEGILIDNYLADMGR